VATEAEWIAAWNEICAGHGKLEGVIVLGPQDLAALRRHGQSITWWRETLALVAGSSFLRGDVKGFRVTPRWLLDHGHRASGRSHRADDVRSGVYADAAPAARAEDAALPEAEIEIVRAWIEGWSRVASLAADPPDGGRTRTRDGALARWIQRWSRDASTDGWTTPGAAERAARALAAQVARDPRLVAPSLDRLLRDRDGSRLEELMREGDRARRTRASRPSTEPAPAILPPLRPTPEAESAARAAARESLPESLRRRLAYDAGGGGS
jgi:hypothetical protein